MIESALTFIAIHSSTLWAIDITVLAIGMAELVIGLSPRWKGLSAADLTHLWKGQSSHGTIGQ